MDSDHDVLGQILNEVHGITLGLRATWRPNRQAALAHAAADLHALASRLDAATAPGAPLEVHGRDGVAIITNATDKPVSVLVHSGLMQPEPVQPSDGAWWATRMPTIGDVYRWPIPQSSPPGMPNRQVGPPLPSAGPKEGDFARSMREWHERGQALGEQLRSANLGNLGDGLKHTVARVAHAAGTNSVTGWQPAQLPTPSTTGQVAKPAQMPAREPWQNDAEYHRMLRHHGYTEDDIAAHEAAQREGC